MVGRRSIQSLLLISATYFHFPITYNKMLTWEEVDGKETAVCEHND